MDGQDELDTKIFDSSHPVVFCVIIVIYTSQ